MCGRLPEQVNTQHASCLKKKKNTKYNKNKISQVNSFNGRLDRFWNDQEVKYNWKAGNKGTGSRSSKSNLITLFFMQQFVIIPDIKAISLRPFEPR